MKNNHNAGIWGGRYIPGDNWVECDICAFKVRASKTRYNHDGLLVCLADWEPQHPQEIARPARREKITPDKVRVDDAAELDTSTVTTVVTYDGITNLTFGDGEVLGF